MALFFDQAWFDQQLENVGKTHNDLAHALNLPLEDLVAIWKDQREISPGEVDVIAAFLSADPTETAKRSGVSTPRPDIGDEPDAVSLYKLHQRVLALEVEVRTLKAALAARSVEKEK